MRILVIGAGVTGSIYASYLINSRTRLEKRLRESVEIKILARGETFNRIRDNGLKISHHIQKIITIDQIPVIKTLENKDTYDYVLIFLRKTQIADILPVLASNNSKNFAFIGNNGTGTEEIKKFLAINKIILGFPGVGGAREGDMIRSVHKNKLPLTMGAAHQNSSKSLRKLMKIMRLSGIAAARCSDMDSWLKYHIALVSPLANALCIGGSDNLSLSRNDDTLKIVVCAIKEGYRALKELNYPVKPAKLMTMMLLPDYVIRGKMKKKLSSEMGKLLIDDQCKVAPEELKAIADEFQFLIRASLNHKENLQKLYQQMV